MIADASQTHYPAWPYRLIWHTHYRIWLTQQYPFSIPEISRPASPGKGRHLRAFQNGPRLLRYRALP